MSRLEFMVTVILPSKGGNLAGDREVIRVDLIDAFKRSGNGRFILSRWFETGNISLADLGRGAFPAEVSEKVGSLGDLLAPCLGAELQEFVAKMGFDVQTAARGNLYHFSNRLSEIMDRVSRASYIAAEQEDIYRNFILARPARPDEIKGAGEMVYDPFTQSYRDEIDGQLLVYLTERLDWRGIVASDFSDINPKTILDSLSEEMCQFVEDGDADLLTDVDELQAFLTTWFESHSIDPDWEQKPEDEASEPDERLLQDPKLTSFLSQWNAKQHVVAFMADSSRYILQPGFTPDIVAGELRKAIDAARQEAEKAREIEPDSVEEVLAMSPSFGAW